MEIPEPVRRLALSPFTELPTPRNTKTFDLDGAKLTINPFPAAQLVFPSTTEFDVEAGVERARSIGREHDKRTLAWWLAPEHDSVAPRLEALGLVNEDTPGFEATENAMALLEPPAVGGANGVEVRVVETWDDYRASVAVLVECFGFPELPEEELRARYEEYCADADRGRSFQALIDGRVVGHAFAAFGDAGLNLFGGSVVPDARGRGVYGALLRARWDVAVSRGTPALTVQAGRMSRPICEHAGFQFVAAARIFVDPL